MFRRDYILRMVEKFAQMLAQIQNRIAERQYLNGFLNAEALRAEVLGSTLIKVSRIVSDIFVWLAQVQTCIRIDSPIVSVRCSVS